jgi:hypothetical protein
VENSTGEENDARKWDDEAVKLSAEEHLSNIYPIPEFLMFKKKVCSVFSFSFLY